MNFIKRIITLIALAAVAATPALQAQEKDKNHGVEAWFMHFDLDWRVDSGLPNKALIVSLQGLANRAAPQFYVVHPPEYQWEITGPLFDFYKRKHGVQFRLLQTADEALAKFKSAAKGYVVWDKTVGASLNVAFTIAGLEDAVVVSEELIPLVEKHGLKQFDDLRGRYTGMTDAQIYQDAYDKYWDRCIKDRVMLMGGHAGAVRMPGMADWGVNQRMFFHDLSANPNRPEHAAELALTRRIFSEIEPNGYVFGWHS